MNIYKITNIKNGKFYIGKTTRTLDTRFKEHCRGSDPDKMPIAAAIKKYGKNCFQIESIYYTNDLVDLNIKEDFFINVLKPDYNAGPGGQGGNLFRGRKHKESTKQLMREKRIGKKDSIETKEKKRIAHTGKKQNEFTIQKKISSQAKVYIFSTPDGQNITFKNLNEFCRRNSLSASAMRGVYFGYRRIHKGYKKGLS
jgi:group I intron endonuclease